MKCIGQSLAALVVAVTIFSGRPVAAAEPADPICRPIAGRMVQVVTGELAAGEAASTTIGRDWQLTFEPADHGWDLRLRDAGGIDLTAVTPPLRGAPNPRELYGWHFRNKDNTGPNTGEVNAPQERRFFVFDPTLSETGAFDPTTAADFDPKAAKGRGVLTVLDFGLADLEPGEQARFVLLKFHLCLSWPETEEALAETGYTREEKELFTACGLQEPLALSAFIRPKMIFADFDGTVEPDIAAPVADMKTGKRAIAICRDGDKLDLIGYDAGIGELVPDYLDRITAWQPTQPGPAPQGANEMTPPVLEGEGILIGKEDSSSVLVYWHRGAWDVYWQGD